MAPRGVVPPKQQRSRETFERILDACERLLRSRRFDEVSVNDLCIEADVSASSLYGRFETKEAVLLALSERHRKIAEDTVARSVQSVAATSAGERDFEAAAREILTHYLAWVRANEHIENAINLEPSAKAQVRSSEEEAIRTATELIVTLVESDDPGLARRIEFAVRVTSSAVQRAVTGPVAWADRMRLDDEALIAELVALVRAYLAGAPAGPDRTTPR